MTTISDRVDETLADVKNLLGQGLLSQARASLEELDEALVSENIPDDQPDLVRLRRNLANFYSDYGLQELARATYALCEPSGTPCGEYEIGERIAWCNSRAMLAEQEGHYRLADRLYSEAAGLYQTLAPDSDRRRVQYTVVSNAALMKHVLGEFEAAQTLLDPEILPDNPTDQARFSFLSARAVVAIERGDFEQGAADLEGAGEVLGRLTGDRRSSVAALKTIEAGALGDHDRQAEGITLLESFLGNRASNPECFPDHHELDPLIELARLKQRSGSADEAAATALLALKGEIGRKLAENSWTIFSILAHWLSGKGKRKTAIFCGKKAAQILHRISAFGSVTPNQKAALWRDKRQTLDLLIALLARAGRFVEADRIERLLQLERLKHQTPLVLRNTETRVQIDLTEPEAELDQRFEVASKLLEDTLAADQNGTGQASDDKTAADARRTTERLVSDLKRGVLDSYPSAAAAFEQAQAGDRDTSRHTGANSIRFRILGNKLAVDAEGHNSGKAYETGASANELLDLAYRLHRSIRTGDSTLAEMSETLFGELLAPALDVLPPREAIKIIAPPELAAVPFSALHDGERYLAERNPLVCLSQIGGTAHAKSTNPHALLCGTSDAQATKTPLAGVIREIDSLEGLLPEFRTLIDSAFTPDRFIEALRQSPSVLHIASHFELKPGNSALSHFNAHANSGLSLEVFRENAEFLAALELAYFSACETGTADHNLMGIDTLADFFLFHGTQSVVATLWPVQDAASARFAESFYASLCAGNEAPQALQEAQLAMIDGPALEPSPQRAVSTTAPFQAASHPYNWAGYKVWQRI